MLNCVNLPRGSADALIGACRFRLGYLPANRFSISDLLLSDLLLALAFRRTAGHLGRSGSESLRYGCCGSYRATKGIDGISCRLAHHDGLFGVNMLFRCHREWREASRNRPACREELVCGAPSRKPPPNRSHPPLRADSRLAALWNSETAGTARGRLRIAPVSSKMKSRDVTYGSLRRWGKQCAARGRLPPSLFKWVSGKIDRIGPVAPAEL